MSILALHALTPNQLPAVVVLDQHCLGGLWTLEGYQRELESPNSDLLVLESIPDVMTPSSRPPSRSSSSHQNPLSSSLTTCSYVLGFACQWAIADEAHITILAVDPNMQRQGLGQTLLWGLLNCARDRGLKWATLEVRESNHAARALYKKFGFQEAGRRRKYYPNTGEDALILWLSGLQTPEFSTVLASWQQQIGDRLSQFGWHLELNTQKPKFEEPELKEPEP